MKRSLAALLVGFLITAPAWADESVGLQFPVEEAREAARAGKQEFLALDLDTGLAFPGLSPDQIDYVQHHYKVRALNQRWNSFENLEERHEEMNRIASYAKRYNMVMWTELEKHRIRDFKKYRY